MNSMIVENSYLCTSGVSSVSASYNRMKTIYVPILLHYKQLSVLVHGQIDYDWYLQGAKCLENLKN